MYDMQRIISKHQHTDGLIALFPQHQMSGNVSYDFGPNQGHGTLSGVGSRYCDHSVSKGHYMNASWYDNKAASYNNILTASLIAAFNGDAGAVIIHCKTDAFWDDAQKRYAIYLEADQANVISLRKDIADGRLSYEYLSGGVDKSIDKNGNTTMGWFSMGIMWDRLVNDEVRIYFDGAYVDRLTTLTAWAGNLDIAIIGAGTTEPVFVWDGGIGITAIYNTIKSDAEMLYLSKP